MVITPLKNWYNLQKLKFLAAEQQLPDSIEAWKNITSSAESKVKSVCASIPDEELKEKVLIETELLVWNSQDSLRTYLKKRDEIAIKEKYNESFHPTQYDTLEDFRKSALRDLSIYYEWIEGISEKTLPKKEDSWYFERRFSFSVLPFPKELRRRAEKILKTPYRYD